MLHPRIFDFRIVVKTAALIATLAAAPLAAHEVKAGDLHIDHPWIRAMPAGARTAAGYMIIANNGREADTLIGASAEGAETVEVHEMSIDNNVMKMRQLKDGLAIKPGETVALKPSSYHLMLIGVKAPFKEGATIKGTIIFAKAGTVPVEFKVEAMGGGTSHDKKHGGAH